MKLSDEALEYLPEMARNLKSTLFSGADLQAVRAELYHPFCHGNDCYVFYVKIMHSAQLQLVHEKLNGNIIA